jgi:hypothetical protein
MDEIQTYDVLLADNKEMSKELHQYELNNKLRIVLRSVALGTFIILLIAFLQLFAVYGANHYVDTQHVSEFWVGIIEAFFWLSGWAIPGYVIWHVVTIIFYTYYNELLGGYEKLESFIIKERIRIAKKVLEEEKQESYDPPA